MLQVFSGTEFERMKNVQPEKSLPLKRSTPSDFFDGEVWHPVNADAKQNSATERMMVFAAVFMARESCDFCRKSSTRRELFLRAFKNNRGRNGGQTFVRVF